MICRAYFANKTKFYSQYFTYAGRPITSWSFVKTDDIQAVKLEHLTNLFRGRVFAKLNIERSNAHRNGFGRLSSCKKLSLKFDLPPITVLLVFTVNAV